MWPWIYFALLTLLLEDIAGKKPVSRVVYALPFIVIKSHITRKPADAYLPTN